MTVRLPFWTFLLFGIDSTNSNWLMNKNLFIPSVLCCATNDLSLPSFKLHPLTGDRKGIWAVSVSGNWRLTFEFHDGDVYILNYEDYH
nr:type II toxin-antitoxin system RelE/ParE family toxin [Xenorhabdus eapokensis]